MDILHGHTQGVALMLSTEATKTVIAWIHVQCTSVASCQSELRFTKELTTYDQMF